MRPWLALCIVLGFCLPALGDDKTYVLKKPRGVPGEGKSIKVNARAVFTSTTRITDENGKKITDEKVETTKQEVGTEKTITDGKPDKDGKRKRVKYQRSFTKAVEGPSDKPMTKSYQGRTVLFELVEGKYRVKAVGKPDLDKEAREELEAEENKEDNSADEQVLLPAKAVKVGETWKVDGKTVTNYLPFLKADPEKCKGEGKLARVYQKNGKAFASITFEFSTTAKTTDLPVLGKVVLTLDIALDGSTPAGKQTMKLTTDQSGTVEKDGKKYQAERKLVMTLEVVVEDVKE